MEQTKLEKAIRTACPELEVAPKILPITLAHVMRTNREWWRKKATREGHLADDASDESLWEVLCESADYQVEIQKIFSHWNILHDLSGQSEETKKFLEEIICNHD